MCFVHVVVVLGLVAGNVVGVDAVVEAVVVVVAVAGVGLDAGRNDRSGRDILQGSDSDNHRITRVHGRTFDNGHRWGIHRLSIGSNVRD